MKLASLWLPHVLTPAFVSRAYLLSSCGPNATNSPMLPLSDYQLLLDRHKHRSTNHAYSEKSKNPRGLLANTPPLQVGDSVYLFSDKDKSRARDRNVVVSIDTPWCFVAHNYEPPLTKPNCPNAILYPLPSLCPALQAIQFFQT